jgi:hypothetical protein
VPRPNLETSYYEVVKIVFERSGVEKDLQRLDVVQGEDRAADRAAHFDRHMTEEARQERNHAPNSRHVAQCVREMAA